MALRNDSSGYGYAALALHWATAVVVLVAWALGQIVDAFGREWEPVVVYAHVTAGMAVAVPSIFDPWLARAATAGHWLLYALLVAIPVTGIVNNFARGNPLPVFGLFEILSPWTRDRAFVRSTKEIHEAVANALLFVALAHAAASLAHHYVLKDDTLRRMLPRRS